MMGRSDIRIREPRRAGQQFVVEIGEDTLPPDHPARLLWTALGQFDLSSFVLDTGSVQGHAGRPVYSPRMMLTPERLHVGSRQTWNFAGSLEILRSSVRCCQTSWPATVKPSWIYSPMCWAP